MLLIFADSYLECAKFTYILFKYEYELKLGLGEKGHNYLAHLVFHLVYVEKSLSTLQLSYFLNKQQSLHLYFFTVLKT